MQPIKQTVRLIRRYIAISLSTESEFRPDFWTSVVQLLLNAVLVIVFWDALFRITGPLKGWTLADLVMMAGLGELSRTIAGLFPGLGQLSQAIVRGDIDRYLTKPAPVLLCYVMERVSVVRILHSFVAGISVIAVAVWQLGFRPTLGGSLLGLLVMIAGRIAFTLLQGVIAMLGFWIGRMDKVQAILDELAQFNRFPVTFFDSPVRTLLTWVWPYGLYLTYPVLLARGNTGSAWLLAGGSILLATAWAAVLRIVLRAGLRRYESYGG